MVRTMTAMATYFLLFAMTIWPPRTQHREREMVAIAIDVASTNATPEEGLILMNIAALESNFNRKALGRAGERGAFQVMPPAVSFGAAEALRRLRLQGIEGYCGCRGRDRCRKKAENRTWQARLWRLGFDPPSTAEPWPRELIRFPVAD
jgi:hypothetical protein